MAPHYVSSWNDQHVSKRGNTHTITHTQFQLPSIGRCFSSSRRLWLALTPKAWHFHSLRFQLATSSCAWHGQVARTGRKRCVDHYSQKPRAAKKQRDNVWLWNAHPSTLYEAKFGVFNWADLDVEGASTTKWQNLNDVVDLFEVLNIGRRARDDCVCSLRKRDQCPIYQQPTRLFARCCTWKTPNVMFDHWQAQCQQQISSMFIFFGHWASQCPRTISVEGPKITNPIDFMWTFWAIYK